MIISKFSKTGTYHRETNRENQDYLYSMEGKDFLAIMLADGATACERGLEGARLSCRAMEAVIKQEGKKFFYYSKEKMAYLLTEQILYYLECYKEKLDDIREYGSTFAMAFMEKKTGRTVLISLGDGAVGTVTENGFSYLLRPRRYRGNPCLTTTKGAAQAVQIALYNLALGDSILVCSDGFLEQMRRSEIVSLLDLYDVKRLNCQLSLAENKDDCSYIAFKRERK